jgi:hypothetical protein
VILRFRSRQEQDPGDDLARRELARAIAKVAARQERALAAERSVAEGLEALRTAMAGGTGFSRLRARHEELSLARSRAAHERAAVARLSTEADRRRAEVARAAHG